ncbi:hypothetical protein [Streptomyces sp. NPDC002209]|uniref:hypothetical protein n=1 Tax=Streptomyces sp. NPDC002209 TaxID=3364638 RepID=UPI0036B50170
MRAVVRQAVRDIRTAPAPPPAEPSADPVVARMRAVVDKLVASTYAIGELTLEVAPAYLSDEQAADVLTLLCDQSGEDLEHGLAARRYAMSGDRRACTAPACDDDLLSLRPLLVAVAAGCCTAGSSGCCLSAWWCCSWSWWWPSDSNRVVSWVLRSICMDLGGTRRLLG